MRRTGEDPPREPRLGDGRSAVPSGASRRPTSYQSQLRVLGLPLIDVAAGRIEEGRYRRGIARGWIAVGDIAFGALIAVGGLALGGLALAGLAVGGVAIGGVAAGGLAVGGLALGWVAAIGGLALSPGIAVGGLALSGHANDGEAGEFLRQPPARLVQAVARETRWLWLLLLVPVIFGLRSRQEDRSAGESRRGDGGRRG